MSTRSDTTVVAFPTRTKVYECGCGSQRWFCGADSRIFCCSCDCETTVIRVEKTENLNTLKGHSDRFYNALEKIALCESHIDGDVVSIARKALEPQP